MALFAIGSLLDDDADVLVCTNNVTGPNGRPAMGKGIALDFKLRWPGILPDYERDCLSGALVGGSCRLYDLPEARDLLSGPSRQRKWAAFCTKHDWRNKSDYRWIASGLDDLVRLLGEGGHRSVAMPPLGCGNGGLEWPRVRGMIEAAFVGSDCELRIYGPPGPAAAPQLVRPRGPVRMPSFAPLPGRLR